MLPSRVKLARPIPTQSFRELKGTYCVCKLLQTRREGGGEGGTLRRAVKTLIEFWLLRSLSSPSIVGADVDVVVGKQQQGAAAGLAPWRLV